MKRKIFVITMSILLVSILFTGYCNAGGDQNTNTNGEDGYYDEHNNNDFDDDDFPGEDSQKRDGVIW